MGPNCGILKSRLQNRGPYVGSLWSSILPTLGNSLDTSNGSEGSRKGLIRAFPRVFLWTPSMGPQFGPQYIPIIYHIQHMGPIEETPSESKAVITRAVYMDDPRKTLGTRAPEGLAGPLFSML